jgi:hypothetical protein
MMDLFGVVPSSIDIIEPMQRQRGLPQIIILIHSRIEGMSLNCRLPGGPGEPVNSDMETYQEARQP